MPLLLFRSYHKLLTSQDSLPDVFLFYKAGLKLRCKESIRLWRAIRSIWSKSRGCLLSQGRDSSGYSLISFLMVHFAISLQAMRECYIFIKSTHCHQIRSNCLPVYKFINTHFTMVLILYGENQYNPFNKYEIIISSIFPCCFIAWPHRSFIMWKLKQ